jgi:tetratricopeptide (TPR) repeat protein
MNDAVLYHLREQVRILSAGPLDADGSARLKRVREAAETFEAVVQDRRSQLALRSVGLGNAPLARANIALQLGLPRAALDDVLLPSTVVLFGVEGAKLEFELLLMLGRTTRARQELNEEQFRQNMDRLGVVEMPGNGMWGQPLIYRLPADAWNRFLLAAADGDYTEAAEALDTISGRLRDEAAARERNARLFLARAAATEVGLGVRPEFWRFYTGVAGDPRQVLRIVEQVNRTGAQVAADVRCLAGLLALERGDPDEATAHFRAALALAPAAFAGGLGFPSEPACRSYLGQITGR